MVSIIGMGGQHAQEYTQNDAATNLGDFRTSTLHPTQSKTVSTVDYTYDANGNLTKDLNKDIGDANNNGITYNFLNLPETISVKATGSSLKGTITYTYDATGNKLKKVVVENASATNGNVTTTTTTTYIGSCVYETKTDNDPQTNDYIDQMQFILHEEGRIRYEPATEAMPSSLNYDYFIKDHLGNVRMVLAEEIAVNYYPAATLEGTFDISTNSMVNHERTFYNIDQSRITPETSIPSWGTETTGNTKLYYNHNNIPPASPNPSYPAGVSPTQATGSTKLYKLNATSNKTGLEFVIKVMAGDKIDIFGKSYYLNTTAVNNSNSTAMDMLSLFTSLLMSPGNDVTSKGISAPQLVSWNLGLVPATFFRGNNNETSTTVPKAYINYIFLDEQFRYVHGNASRVGNSGTVKNHWAEDASLQNINVQKNGYLFVYVSNESNFDVFFDNLQVVHKPGPILEETHYYPFGLTMAGISSKALKTGYAENKMKFQGQEFASKEFSDGSGLEMYEFKWRMHDPQIGRFWQVDPLSDKYVYNSTYAFSENKVTSHVELEGLEARIAIAGSGTNASYDRSSTNAFNARAKNLEKTSGFTAVQVNNGDQIVDQLRQGTANEGSVGAVVIFAHASQEGVYLDKEDGFYRGKMGFGGSNSANVGELKAAVDAGEVKFDENAVIVFGACNCGKSDGLDPLAVSLTKELGVTTVGATGNVYPEVVDGKETGRLKTDGTFNMYKMTPEVTFEIPGYGSVTIPAGVGTTNLGNTIDPTKLTPPKTN